MGARRFRAWGMSLAALTAAGAGVMAWSYLRVEPPPGDRAGLHPPRRLDPAAQARRDAQVAHARSLLEVSDFSAAVAALDRAMEAAPGDAEALALQVRAFRARRLYGAARDAALLILEASPRSPLPHVLLASIALQEGDAATARAELERAAEMDASSALPLADLAALDLMEGRLDSARARAARALALEPDNDVALTVMTRATRSVPELIALHRRRLEAAPDDLAARSWLDLLQRSPAPEINHVISPLAESAVPLEAGLDGRLYLRADLPRRRGLRLLVDTGASGLVLSEALARRLGMPLREYSESSGLGGLTRHSHPILLDRIDVGGVRCRALAGTATALPSGEDGIINPMVLAPAGSGLLLELRPGRPSLALLSGPAADLPPARLRDDGWIAVPFLSDGHHPLFRIVLGGRPATALLDTGAAADIVDHSVLERLPQPRVLPATESGAMLLGFGGRVRDAETLEEVTLRIAGRDFVTRHLFVVDLNEAAFRFRVDLDAVVGIGSLRAFDIRIDPGRGRILFRGAT